MASRRLRSQERAGGLREVVDGEPRRTMTDLSKHSFMQERGETSPSITAMLLEGMYRTGVQGVMLSEEEEIVKNVGAVAFEGEAK